MTDIYPKTITRNESAPDKELKIIWSDEKISIYKFTDLRFACQCAMCKHELTGEKLIKIEDIPKDINLSKVESVGNYAIHIVWSDGHSTGFFSYDYLRSLIVNG